MVRTGGIDPHLLVPRDAGTLNLLNTTRTHAARQDSVYTTGHNQHDRTRTEPERQSIAEDLQETLSPTLQQVA